MKYFTITAGKLYSEKKVKIYCNKEFVREVKTTKENLTDAELLQILRLYEIEKRGK